MVETRIFIEKRAREKMPYGVGAFMMVSQGGLCELENRLADRSIGKQAMRVLIAMLCSVTYENRVDASQKEMSAALGMSQQEVSKAIRALIECGFIERLANRRGWYRISPEFSWKGSARTLQHALDERVAA